MQLSLITITENALHTMLKGCFCVLNNLSYCNLVSPIPLCHVTVAFVYIITNFKTCSTLDNLVNVIYVTVHFVPRTHLNSQYIVDTHKELARNTCGVPSIPFVYLKYLKLKTHLIIKTCT